MPESVEQIDLDEEWSVCDYDDGPITIDDPIVRYKTFDAVSRYRLKDMVEKYPALRKSWEAFIIDYNVCLANEWSNEQDDIPF